MFDDADESIDRGPLAGDDDEPADEDVDDTYDDFDEEYTDLDEDEATVATIGNGPVSGSPREDLARLVEYLATNLVDDPSGVTVEAEQRGQIVNLTLRVPEEELGKVIGRQGRIARAIRTILTIAGSRQNVRASLDIEG